MALTLKELENRLKVQEDLVETVPESKLVKFKVDIKIFNDMRL